MTVYKFRGKMFETGEFVYGDLIQGDNGEHYEYEVKYRAFTVAKDGCYLTASQFKTRAIK